MSSVVRRVINIVELRHLISIGLLARRDSKKKNRSERLTGVVPAMFTIAPGRPILLSVVTYIFGFIIIEDLRRVG